MLSHGQETFLHSLYKKTSLVFKVQSFQVNIVIVSKCLLCNCVVYEISVTKEL